MKSCTWIFGDPRKEWRYCDCQALPGKSWCGVHEKIVFRKPEKKGIHKPMNVRYVSVMMVESISVFKTGENYIGR